jgi:hypothetical protein
MNHSASSFWASVITFLLIVTVLYVFVNVGFIAGAFATFLFVCVGLIGGGNQS